MSKSVTNIQYQIHLMYELSLSIGQSLDTNENCLNFCLSLMSKKNMSYSSVWIDMHSTYNCEFSFPEVMNKNQSIEKDNDFRKELMRKRYLIQSKKDNYFDYLCSADKTKGGTYLVFDLPHIGFLKLHTNSDNRKFTEIECEQLVDLMNKFATSLVACFSFQRTMEENKRRSEIQRNLEIANQKALESSKMKSLFLANMSHEIRTPLNAIIGFANLLNNSKLSGAQNEQVKQICTAGNSLLRTINEVLDFSKIESGTISVAEAPFIPKILLNEVMHILEPLALENNVRIKIGDFDVPENNFIGDEGRISQTLINLGANAIKFSPNGEVIFNWIHGKNNLSAISIEDNGIGIDPKKIPHIFNAFEQADNSSTRRVGGSGLGLAITKGLVEAMNGKIEASSTLRQGSTFTMTIPFTIESTQTKKTSIDESLITNNSDLSGYKILIVEDNPMNQIITKAYLEQAGAVTEIAENGSIAYERVSAKNFDLILMDCQMPVMDGYAATKKIRESGITQLPILALTAHAFSTDRDRCLSAGMNDYITKPISQDQLIKKILFWLNRKKRIRLAV